ncbi:hypothetical protein MPH_10027 [Macrophomina phaseolina MS6]|uniref:Alpha/beta hydrolase fold-3 domain-containing protein n=1 Tax=Macrophomina phaseolina (strain MS6) TaxID=1126212 RepID=K2RRD3_MACPH|nr:hypothetical protein MPH_10027 [Macrophomina phaseolina MS6]
MASSASSSSILTRQPFKAAYALYAILLESVRLPVWMLVYILPSLRPERNWTHRQAVGTHLLRAIVHHSAVVEVHVPLSMTPGPEGDRFVTMAPAESSMYLGPLADAETKPAKIGGTWYSEPYAPAAPPTPASAHSKAVVLHFHGGAFVLGDGREKDCGPLARTMLRRLPSSITHVFCPQYRLAGAPSRTRFPGALQDAVTAYLYLLRAHRIPPSRIILSGDSAGGNIVNGLLRYIAVYGEELDIPAPACAWLWSPWINPSIALDTSLMVRSPNFRSDYISEGFGAWGCRMYAPHCDVRDAWISGGGHPFKSPAPIWVQTGGRELLFHDNVEFFEGLRKVNGEEKDGGVPCELEILPYAPHDIPLVGHIIGFSKEYADVLKKAESFYQRVRK